MNGRKSDREERARLFVHPPIKLFTTDMRGIAARNGCFFFHGIKIHKVEAIGYVFKSDSRGVFLRDAFGTFFASSGASLAKGLWRVTCSLSMRHGEVQYRCIEWKRASFYEEVFFWREAVEYKRRIAQTCPIERAPDGAPEHPCSEGE